MKFTKKAVLIYITIFFIAFITLFISLGLPSGGLQSVICILAIMALTGELGFFICHFGYNCKSKHYNKKLNKYNFNFREQYDKYCNATLSSDKFKSWKDGLITCYSRIEEKEEFHFMIRQTRHDCMKNNELYKNFLIPIEITFLSLSNDIFESDLFSKLSIFLILTAFLAGLFVGSILIQDSWCVFLDDVTDTINNFESKKQSVRIVNYASRYRLKKSLYRKRGIC